MPVFFAALLQLVGALASWIVAYRIVKLGFFVSLMGAVALGADFAMDEVIQIIETYAMPIPTWLEAPLSWIIPDNFVACIGAYYGARAGIATFHWLSYIAMTSAKIASGT